MKIRAHRGPLTESMETVQTIEATREAIAQWAQKAYGIEAPPAEIEVSPYGFDDRIQWNTHLVSLNGYGVLGFSDSPVP